MPNEQVKGTLLAVGATAASTALLVGGIVGIHSSYESATGVDPSTVIDYRAKQASDAASGGTGEFSDHCLVMREGYMVAVPSASWTTDGQGNLVMDSLPETLNWQWVNRVTGSYQAAVPGTGTTYTMLSTIVANPADRTQANLNAWFNQIKAGDNGGHLMIGWGNPTPERAQTYPYSAQRVFAPIAAHCRWMPTVEADSTNHKTDTDGVLRSDVTIGNDTSYGSDPWLSVDGDQAVVKATGRAYYSATPRSSAVVYCPSRRATDRGDHPHVQRPRNANRFRQQA